VRRAPILILIALLAFPALAGAAAEPPPGEPEVTASPNLGAKAFAGNFGAGFGRAEPEVIFNGGDPSGEVSKIKWSRWGEPSAIGYGLNPIFKPGGGYYRAPARVELRATKLGECGTTPAYTRLEIRVPRKPGGKLGRWRLWSGAKTICEAPR
jgi:hypothetical protein